MTRANRVLTRDQLMDACYGGLALARKTPPPIAVVLPDDPRVRDLRVTPHALTQYDALSQETDDDTAR